MTTIMDTTISGYRGSDNRNGGRTNAGHWDGSGYWDNVKTYDLSSYGVTDSDIILVVGTHTGSTFSDYESFGYSGPQATFDYTLNGNILTVTAHLWYDATVWYEGGEWEGWRGQYNNINIKVIRCATE